MAKPLKHDHRQRRWFLDLNKYRIDEAKALLNDDHLNISDVLYASGFNNRVSFYKAFKKFEGITPTEFRSKMEQAS